MKFEKRVARLEQVSNGERLHIVNLREGQSQEEAIKAAGVDPGPNDLVVLIAPYAVEPEANGGSQ